MRLHNIFSLEIAMRIKILLFALLIFSLASCNTLTPTAELPTLPLPTEAPTAAPLPTDTAVPPTEVPTLEPTAVPTQAPTEIPGTLVEFNGVSFRLPTGVGSTINGEIIPAATDPNLPFFGQNPVQIQISLPDYVLQEKLHHPRLIVSPIAGYQELGQAFTDRFAELQSVIDTRPADLQTMPFIPFFNAMQVFHTTPVYLDFQNGSGVRYLTQYDQAIMPITNHSLFYTFQGITSDGKYSVVLIVPVSHPSLPANETENTDWQTQAFLDNFPTYLAGVQATLNAAAPDEFVPSLTELDALVTSLLVQPVGLP
jgi:hypothetical protein